MECAEERQGESQSRTPMVHSRNLSSSPILLPWRNSGEASRGGRRRDKCDARLGLRRGGGVLPRHQVGLEGADDDRGVIQLLLEKKMV